MSAQLTRRPADPGYEAPAPSPVTRPIAVERRARRRIAIQNVGAMLALGWIVALTAAAILVEWLPVPSYDAIVGAPFQAWFTPDAPLGTDSIGRSVLSRVLYGARASLTIGFVAALIGVAIGGLIGMFAGYFRGAVEVFVDIMAEVVQAFPPMLFLIALAAAVRPSLATLTVSMAILMVPAFARMTKGAVLAQSGREFVSAARGLGAGHLRIIFREIFPNTLMSLVSFTIIVMALLIVIEGSVSFLGYGIPVPYPSWGGMVAESQSQLATHPVTVMVPIVFLFLTVYALNSLGDWLRARFDVGQSQL